MVYFKNIIQQTNKQTTFMAKILFMKCMLLLFLLSEVYAQSQTITGKVTDSVSGQGLPGVTLLVKGTSNGTTTDVNGDYTINAPASGILTFSFIGYSTEERAIGNTTTINVIMQPDARQLNEVVVTAIGIERERKSLGYATQPIKAEQISQKAEPNLVNALQGKIPGVSIVSSSGAPGASSNIVIRGFKSIGGENQPLFVVDGIPIDNRTSTTESGLFGSAFSSRSADINPEDIESINVLKGPAASALYGSRAANGAIIITTKRGGSKDGGMSVSVTSSYVAQQVRGLPVYQNEYGQGSLGVYRNDLTGSWGPKFTADVPEVVDFRGEKVPYQAYGNNVQDFFDIGQIFTNNLQLSGGDRKNNFILSLGNANQSGVIPDSKFNRNNVRLGGNSQLTEKLKAGGSISYINTTQDGSPQGNSGSSPYFTLPTMPRSYNLNEIPFEDAAGKQVFYSLTRDHPLWSIKYNPYNSSVNRITGNVNVGYDFTKWLNVTYQIGADTYDDTRKQVYGIGSGRVRAGRILDEKIIVRNIESNLLTTITKDINEDFGFRLLLGHNVNQRSFDRSRITGTEIIVPGNYNINNAKTFSPAGTTYNKRRLIGAFADLGLSYKDYLFLNIKGRNDWSSTLPLENISFFYPAVDASFVFTEAFNLTDNRFLSYGKLRGNYAKVGLDAPAYYLSTTFDVPSLGNNVAGIQFPFNGTAGYTVGDVQGNASLTPEFTTSYEFGTELAFFNKRINLDLTYYNATSEDQIQQVDIPASSGFTNLNTNIGTIVNKGFELGLTFVPLQIGNFKWESTLNGTRNISKVTDLGEGLDRVQQGGFIGFGSFLIVGQPYGVMVGPKNARDPETGKLLINETNGLLLTGPQDEIIGNPNPDFTGSFINSFTYKGFRLGVQVDFQQGGDLYSGTVAGAIGQGVTDHTAENRDLPRVFDGYLASPTGEIRKNADGAKIQNNIYIPAQQYWASFGQFSEGGVFDASHVRLRELVIGYAVPASVLGKLRFVKGLDVSLTGRNLFVYAPNLRHIDPEINGEGAGANSVGFEFNAPPQTRNYGINLRLNF
jgi:TonB-linked SusC/RagA family outer membrane protein